MARAKVQTSRKRVNRKKEELQAPDEVTTALQKLSEHLNEHFKLYAVGLAALLVLALVVDTFMDSRTSAAVERAEAYSKATASLHATVGEFAEDEKPFSLQGPAPKVSKPDFDTDKKRWEAALSEVKSARDAAGDDLGEFLGLLEGRIELEQGNAADAAKAFDAFVAEEEDSSFLPIVIENQGHAAEAQGDLAGAAKYYEKLTELGDLYYRVHGAMLLGDLYNPGMGKGDGKDAGLAKKHYQAALDTLKPADGQVLPGALRGLRMELKRRQAGLQG